VIAIDIGKPDGTKVDISASHLADRTKVVYPGNIGKCLRLWINKPLSRSHQRYFSFG